MTGTSPAVDLEHLLAEESFVRSLARSLLFDEHQVDDVVQQTWLQALRRPPENAASPRGWLAQVVRSQASNLRRGDKRRRDREQAVVEGLPSNEEILGREMRRREVVESAVALPEPYRSAILLRYFEQLPPRAIAARLGVPRGTVATRLKRALQMLRGNLDERNGGDRRGWCLALIPLAAPPRAAAGMLLTKATGLLGALWAMKQLGLLLVAIAAMLVLGLQLLSDGGAAGVAEAERVPAVVMNAPSEAPVDPVPIADATEGAAPLRRVADESAESPSVERALAGFRGRLLLPDGAPAVGQLVRVIGVEPSMAFGGDADPFEGVRYSGPVSRSARTDSAGNFLVEGMWPGALCALHAGVDGPHPRLSLLSQTPGPAEVVDLGDVEMAAKGAVRGQVVDPAGEPVADAEVWAVDLPGALLDMAPLDRFGPGSALFVALPRVDSAQSPERDPQAYGGILRRHVSMKLFRQVPTDGWVVMELPAWGNRFVAEWPIPRTRTAADGTFHLIGVDPGANVLVVRRSGLATGGNKRVLIKAGETRDVGELRLGEGEIVSGVVVDGEGRPVPGAQVRVAPRPALGLSGLLFAERPHATGADGRFSVTGLPRGGAVVAARRNDGTPWSFADDVEAGEENVEVRLHSAQLDLHVRSAAEADLGEVQFVVVQGPPIGELSQAGLTPALDLEHCLTDLGEGRYRLHDLVPGLYTVHVKASSHAPDSRVVRIDETSAEGSVEVVLHAEASCVVEVVDRRGRPVHGARVYAQPAATPAWAHSVVMGNSREGFTPWSRLPRLAGRTDVTGHLAVSGLPTGEALFSVRHPAFGAAATRVRVPGPQRFVLEETGSIRGRLFDRGQPARADTWRLLAVSREGKDVAGMPPPVGQAVPDAEGNYAFAGLPPGRYSVRVESSLADVTSFGALFEKLKGTYTGSFFERVREEAVAVLPGRETRLDLDVDETRGVPGTTSVRLSGRISIDGVPTGDLQLFSGDFLFESLLTRTRVDGTFVVDRLKPQSLWLRVADPSHPTSSLWRAPLSVGDRDLQLDIELRTGTLRGRVLAKSGEPAAEYSVAISGWIESSASGLENSEPRSHTTVVTDAQGRFEARLPKGRYVCRIAGRLGRGLTEECVVEAGASVDCEITLKPDGVLAGRVVLDRPINDLEWLWVRMKKDSDDEHGWSVARVAENGDFHFADAIPGRYRLFLLGHDYDERKAVPHVVEIPEGGRLDLELRAGELVEDRDGF